MEESPVIAVKKKSLVNKLDDLARREFCLFVINLDRCEFKSRCTRYKSQMKMAVDQTSYQVGFKTDKLGDL